MRTRAGVLYILPFSADFIFTVYYHFGSFGAVSVFEDRCHFLSFFLRQTKLCLLRFNCYDAGDEVICWWVGSGMKGLITGKKKEPGPYAQTLITCLTSGLGKEFKGVIIANASTSFQGGLARDDRRTGYGDLRNW